MIKKALKSKYIRIFLAWLLVFSAVYAVCIMTIGKDAWNTLDWDEYFGEEEEEIYESLHESGKYKIVGNGEGDSYTIVSLDGEILYESESYPNVLPKEGYVNRINEDGKASLYNFYTSETEWVQKGRENIEDYRGGFWIVCDYIKGNHKSLVGYYVYYLMDDDYTLDKDGMLFTNVSGRDNYLVCNKVIGYECTDVDKLQGVSKEDLELECVVLIDGEIVYTGGACEDGFAVVDDTIHLLGEDENDACRCISLTLGKEVEADCDVDH